MAARGLDVDDIDVVIHMSCKEIDSFVHRSGRTARKGKEGLNILFFEKDEMRFVLNLEKELNINIDFATSIDDIETSNSEDEQSFGPFVQKLEKSSKNPKFFRSNMLDKKGTDQIYSALASENLTDDAR